jgi:flagellar hook-length control protein FliK
VDQSAGADPTAAIDPAALADVIATPVTSPGAAYATNASPLNLVTASRLPGAGRVSGPAQRQDGDGSPAQDPIAIDPLSGEAGAVQATNLNISETHAAGGPQSLPAGSGAPPSVAAQVTPALISMAQGNGAGGRLSISITPDQLGQVHITVERATDGTTSIHVAAEHLGTLNMLQHDQADLTRALDQAGISQEGHSLSFSWNGGDGSMQGWNAPTDQRSERPPANISKSYAVETAALPSIALAATRGGVDLTA